jgi:Protein of unknown function (DUF998)
MARHKNPRAGLALVMGGCATSVLVEAVVQCLPPHPSPVSQTESELALGPFGAVASLNFLARGALTLVFLQALVTVVPPARCSGKGLVFLGASALLKVVVGLAPTDPTPRPETIHGTIHAAAAFAGFLMAAFGQLWIVQSLWKGIEVDGLGKTIRALARASVVLALAASVTVPFMMQLGVWGLIERSLTVTLIVGQVLVAFDLWRRTEAAPSGLPGSTLSG